MVILLLAIHPEIQDNVVNELQNVFSAADEDVTEERLQQMTYLEMVVKETLRHSTTSSFIARSVTKDIKIGKTFEVQIDY